MCRAILRPRTPCIAAVTGMGYLFSSADDSARRMQSVVVAVLRIVLRRANVWIVVQNEDDRALLEARGLGEPARTAVIPGVGVDLDEFAAAPLPDSPAPVVLLSARLIRDKGIEDFVAAAAIVKRDHPASRFVLVGALDPDNPAAFPESRVREWIADGAIEWWGYRDDMAAAYREATIVCLPSYREGFPESPCSRPPHAAVRSSRRTCRAAARSAGTV